MFYNLKKHFTDLPKITILEGGSIITHGSKEQQYVIMHKMRFSLPIFLIALSPSISVSGRHFY